MTQSAVSSIPPFRLRILRSGSGGNAIFIDAGDTRLLIDAGLPAEALIREVPASSDGGSDITAILLTHEHDDHARGAGALARMMRAPVLANEGTIRAAGDLLNGAPVERFITSSPFAVGSLEVNAFLVPHDAVEPVGFVISRGDLRVIIATDLGEATDELIELARIVDLVILEANYDLRLLSVSPYPWFLKNRILSSIGHLSNDAAARVVVAAASDRPQTVFLVHLSDINNLTPLARDTVQWALEREGVTQVRVEAVRPNGASRSIELPQ